MIDTLSQSENDADGAGATEDIGEQGAAALDRIGEPDANAKFAASIMVALETCTNERWAKSRRRGRRLGRTGGEPDCLDRTVHVIEAASAKMEAGDQSAAADVLSSQALVLDEVFNQFARLAVHNPALLERFMRTALKAQSQCRSTLKSLTAVKGACPAPAPEAPAKTSRKTNERTIESGKTPA
jgi:hypothetical protein